MDNPNKALKKMTPEDREEWSLDETDFYQL